VTTCSFSSARRPVGRRSTSRSSAGSVGLDAARRSAGDRRSRRAAARSRGPPRGVRRRTAAARAAVRALSAPRPRIASAQVAPEDAPAAGAAAGPGRRRWWACRRRRRRPQREPGLLVELALERQSSRSRSPPRRRTRSPTAGGHRRPDTGVGLAAGDEHEVGRGPSPSAETFPCRDRTSIGDSIRRGAGTCVATGRTRRVRRTSGHRPRGPRRRGPCSGDRARRSRGRRPHRVRVGRRASGRRGTLRRSSSTARGRRRRARLCGGRGGATTRTSNWAPARGRGIAPPGRRCGRRGPHRRRARRGMPRRAPGRAHDPPHCPRAVSEPEHGEASPEPAIERAERAVGPIAAERAGHVDPPRTKRSAGPRATSTSSCQTNTSRPGSGHPSSSSRPLMVSGSPLQRSLASNDTVAIVVGIGTAVLVLEPSRSSGSPGHRSLASGIRSVSLSDRDSRCRPRSVWSWASAEHASRTSAMPVAVVVRSGHPSWSSNSSRSSASVALIFGVGDPVLVVVRVGTASSSTEPSRSSLRRRSRRASGHSVAVVVGSGQPSASSNPSRSSG